MKIVIIDDDRAILRSLSLILAGQGYETTVFTDPAEAEQCLINRSLEPDVLLVDYLLPGMNGCRLIERLRTKLIDLCPVMMISGHTNQVKDCDLARAGVDHFLPKPLDLERLVEILEQVRTRKLQSGSGV